MTKYHPKVPEIRVLRTIWFLGLWSMSQRAPPNRFIRFCTAHGCVQQTQKETHRDREIHRQQAVTIVGIVMLRMRCDLITKLC